MVLVLDDHPIARQGLESVIKLHRPDEESDFVKAKNMGIDAYILKDAFIDDIMYSLRVVDRGGKFYSSDLMANVGNTSEDDKRIDTLTRRELEVALLLREGYSNAKIANNLSISEGTVKKHISNIFSKLEIYNRTEVLVFVEKHMERFQTILNS